MNSFISGPQANSDRNILCTSWCGKPYYAKSAVNSGAGPQSSGLCIAAMTQPDNAMEILSLMCQTDDGLADRYKSFPFVNISIYEYCIFFVKCISKITTFTQTYL